ncbi:hypothetical protein Focb16_v011215 [Fusarium oxysporum f. sp. cubense]|uniref:Uncharacterized protein n=1 Tax=Fusarium oxysporum f. sp. cubense TaxID=61366 RepID=A0A559L3E6_FUSOC|nr:hypothetical protein Focb16_v011215 [Fusarium oxysporum f. sp. cubense]
MDLQQMYSASAPEVREYLPQFSEEAEKRWSDEKATDSLPNLAGMQLLGLAYLGDGKDHYILTYVTEANAMGTRMGQFGVKTDEVASKSQEITPELQTATSYAAWGTFNWIVLMALFYQQPGLAYTEYSPGLPIPRHSRHRSRGDSAKPVRESLQSTYMGVVYRNNYATSTYTMLWHTALIYIINATLDNAEDPTWRFYLVFSIQCYKSLRQSYRFAEAIGRSLISLAMQKRDLSASEARHMTQKFEEERLSKPSDDILATFMADLCLAMTDPQEASVETLASGFEDIALFQEFAKFTNKEDSSEVERLAGLDAICNVLMMGKAKPFSFFGLG